MRDFQSGQNLSKLRENEEEEIEKGKEACGLGIPDGPTVRQPMKKGKAAANGREGREEAGMEGNWR